MTIPYTPQQLADALAALKTADGVRVIPTDENNGCVKSPKADFLYSFDKDALTVTIIAKHGMAKMASDDLVYAHIHDELMKVV